MKRISVLISLTLIVSAAAFPQTYQGLISKAEDAYAAKQYKESNELYQEAFKQEAKNPGDLYNAACSAALAGDRENAFKFLKLSIDRGWTNIRHLKNDSDLGSLYTDKRWNEMVNDLQKKVDAIEANYDKPLQKELLKIYEDDQTIRLKFMEVTKKDGFQNPTADSLGKMMLKQDSINLLKITRILDEKGWVGKDKIGAQANQTLFLVIQHADLQTQQKYLPMMQEAVKKGDADAGSLALLEDRIAIREGRKQIYGSQIGWDENTKRYYVSPLEDPDHVDVRRAEAGLRPMADYLKNWDLTWSPEEYKKQLPWIEKISRPK